MNLGEPGKAGAMIMRMAGSVFLLIGLVAAIPGINNTLSRYVLSFMIQEVDGQQVVMSGYHPFAARAAVVSVQIVLIALGGFLLIRSGRAPTAPPPSTTE